MAIHESSVNYQNLIRDLADMYTFEVAEVVLVELVANSLDAKPTRISIDFDPLNKVLIITDDGKGMNASEFDQYHDFAAGLKTRGTGIGFAGVGAKVSFNIANKVVTETHSKSFSACSNWYLQKKKLVWEDIPPTHLHGQGTRVEVTFRPDAKLPYFSAEDLVKLLRRHYLPLLNTEFLALYKQLGYYSIDLRFIVSGKTIQPGKFSEDFALEKVRKFFPLNTFSQWQHAFTFEELSDYIDSYVDSEMLQRAITHDSRFIFLGDEISNRKYFIPDKALFLWFCGLSIRLAQAKQVRLSSRQIGKLLSSLHPSCEWVVPPSQVIKFGQSFGFISSTYTSGQYVFPMAHILSFMSYSRMKVASAVLKNIVEMPKVDIDSEQLLSKLVEEGFSGFSPKISQIVKAREGLLEGAKMTLEQIGNNLRLTRERIRQIEAEFWKRIQHPQSRSIRYFIEALLFSVMHKQGSLIIRNSSLQASLTKFIVKSVNIPYTEFPHTGISILGASKTNITILKSTEWFSKEIDANAIAARLKSEGQFCLIDSDLMIIAENITRVRQKHLTKGQGVYLALKAIGKPAHYTEITQVYDSLFPDYPSTEHTIHAVLSREIPGIVWIGVRGTYALVEWGYERPSKTLFDAVTEIVERKYLETSKPVPFQIIVAEIGKYRQIVRPSSLIIAAQCNPCLKRVYRDCFIPKASDDQTQEEISAEELDKILREFEKQAVDNTI